jgi:hypothetical protein
MRSIKCAAAIKGRNNLGYIQTFQNGVGTLL